jgi:hypothetical protein
VSSLNSSSDLSHYYSVSYVQGREIPTTIAASWLNWIILRFTFLLPLNYLLNINAFIFHWFGMNCCSRMVRGGGPGGPVPYRVYVDSCMVILCLLALAPASPLIAPACLLYFLLCQPLFRCKQLCLPLPAVFRLSSALNSKVSLTRCWSSLHAHRECNLRLSTQIRRRGIAMAVPFSLIVCS